MALDYVAISRARSLSELHLRPSAFRLFPLTRVHFESKAYERQYVHDEYDRLRNLSMNNKHALPDEEQFALLLNSMFNRDGRLAVAAVP